MYIYHHIGWPHFQWSNDKVTGVLAELRFRQGKLLGYMQSLGFLQREEASLQTLTQEVVKSSEIEGEILDREQVRSSIARHLGIEIAGSVPADRHVDGVVEMMLDATQRFNALLDEERLYGWHAALFPTGRSGLYKITVGAWRTGEKGPVQIVSGAIGRERVHYEAPSADKLPQEMKRFLDWFNNNQEIDPILKAAIAHLWFVTIHPFEDGNGRIARAIADMLLARADDTNQRFYSMSAQIRKERNDYYNILEKTQKGTLDITGWISWFLTCLDRSLNNTDEILSGVLRKARFWEEASQYQFNPRQLKMINTLLDGFEGKLTSSKWAKIAQCSQDTAIRDIQDLIEKNILVREPGGGRNTSYIMPLPS